MQIEIWRNGSPDNPDIQQFYPILLALEKGCRDINMLMRRVSTDNLDGLNFGSTVNIQGENQRKLDILANTILKNALCCSGVMDVVASEEEDEPCVCSKVVDNSAFFGDFAAVFDPLDGSSNIDSGLPTGSIFGIYKKSKYNLELNNPLNLVKQRGIDLVIAGYCIYSSSTHLVLTMKTGLHMFTLDDVSGEFYLTKSHIKIPSTIAASNSKESNTVIYSFNDAYHDEWSPAIRNFISDLRKNKLPESMVPATVSRKPTARYMGALVADVHNILLNGGIFGYPGTLKKPSGKLRLVYEANPLAMVIEEAGGKASDGNSRILELQVQNVHQRVPLFIGSSSEVSAIEKYIKFYHGDL